MNQVPSHQAVRLKAAYTFLLALLEEADHAASRAFAMGNDPVSGLLLGDAATAGRCLRQEVRRRLGRGRLRDFQRQAERAGLPAGLLRAFRINLPRDRAPAGPSREPSYRLVEDREGERHRPFRLRRAAEPLLGDGGERGLVLSPDALADLQEGRARGWVQLVILNTVWWAQRVYRQLADLLGPDRIGLLHSRFAYEDRRRHEESFLKRFRRHEAGLILVATQVVEVSLDLSADRMFSELATFDALGHRGGRVHRGCRRPDGRELSVWLPPDGLPYLRGEKALEDPRGILRRSWGALPTGVPAQGEWRALCGRLYADRVLGPSNLPELFRAYTLFGPSPYDEIRFDEWSGRVFKPRAVLQPTVNVVSRDLMDELGEEALNDHWQVPVPQWWVLRSLVEKTEHFIPHTHLDRSYLLCTLPYSHQLGFCESTDQARHDAFIDLD